ncbi:hypothetical protein A3B21_00035 [Candidatus Uhrbacteria bacterium RIFCSPLOWO2_01_FULL_47_24]|uniref:Gluconeogenesis factor n=1 Tax=Candidatus Uhrbacteria bacterium RIFCSPLOWO2_01_FULL_47_24 TaxID=1802401 RepID=A0A1F7UTX9_9BACT|nr:MAG: hypothetical protein A2753_00325 [Candidatus Uhrbacteria bacterium RIFCSPHIGHO2_01_FULL_47_11]OGL69255.1 MAG: hypothetical protein A3D58_03090 [Candidatus Uhrbacteria bacterium RIFCSPHIGHO2_02_FULL_46_47]OGL76473.1 MAG: hypothetical protein A3F52_01505 [Candidatus Uhrbacteria bacterium RIFCSPHIGHO2_12_FULL_47_11]OGL81751.1 MAG: hypothetical protein A3B21_00035 [Candidatus Uhrbacteria bacterium RIFCSPLOWO2_01_FULL_47_24]OGL85384.1 MAG: hypothetical protein A3J03_04865 [Candidatus Uhrbact
MEPKVVTIGGGTGHYEFLRALRRLELEPTALVSMADDGESSGEMRDKYGALPPGDLLQCLTALTTLPREVVRHILRTRMTRGALGGHNIGNLVLTFAASHGGSFLDAVAELEDILKVRGHVLPITVGQVRLHGVSERGVEVHGEARFDQLGKLLRPGDRITRVWLDPNEPAVEEALEVIRRAQFLFLMPGDLWSSIAPVLLVQGVYEAIAASRAQIIYTCNLVTTRGQTDNFTVVDFVTTLDHLLPRPVDTVLYHSHGIDADRSVRYAAKDQAYSVEFGDLSRLSGRKLLGSDYLAPGELVRHNHAQLALVLGILLGKLPPHSMQGAWQSAVG